MNFNEILAKAIQEMNDAENAAKTDDIMESMLSVLVDISNTLNTIAATLRQWMEISR